MTVTVDLADDVEKALERKALRQGITTSEYIRRMAERAARPSGRRKQPSDSPAVTPSRARTGAELLAQLDALNLPPGYGDPAIDAHELAHQLTACMSRPTRPK